MKQYYLLIALLLIFSCSSRFGGLPEEVKKYYQSNLHNPNSFELVKTDISTIEESDVYSLASISDLEYYNYSGTFKNMVDKHIQTKTRSKKVVARKLAVKFRSKNSFGAKTINTHYFVLAPNNEIIGIHDSELNIYNELIRMYYFKSIDSIKKTRENQLD